MMLNVVSEKNKQILVVAYWPLGGIRTYMRYTFRHLPESYRLTLLVTSTQEDAALAADVKDYRARLLIVQKKGLMRAIFHELRKNRYDVILSQGFLSSFYVYFPNKFFRIPHVLTIHGIVEPRFLSGKFSWVKRFLLRKILSDLTVLHGVSHDILTHLYEQFPSLSQSKEKSVVIPNGIEMTEFALSDIAPGKVRHCLGIDSATFLFGFFGRFMQQKGFDLLIDAVDILRKKERTNSFAVLAVGSGDYLSHYQQTIKDRDLEQYFIFLPFQPQIKEIYLEVNAIVMPSRWEAAPLQPMETLSLGLPFIASDCIGLRETVRDTPATVFESENIDALAETLQSCMDNLRIKEFKNYVPIARKRFDVVNSSNQLIQVIENLSG